MLCINLKIKSTSQLQTKVKDQIISAHLLKREIGQIKINDIVYWTSIYTDKEALFNCRKGRNTHQEN